jgi:hypothetical protein
LKDEQNREKFDKVAQLGVSVKEVLQDEQNHEKFDKAVHLGVSQLVKISNVASESFASRANIF